MALSRRQFLKHGALATAASVLPWQNSMANSPFALRAGTATKQLNPGSGYQASKVFAFNQTVPGPLLRYNVGDIVSVDFDNALPEESSVHWHGIRNINAMDGVAGLTQPAVQTGAQFRYEFPLPDPGTYWYHSHAKAWAQVARGLYGPLIVDGPEDPSVDHDLILMIDDWRLADDGRIDEASFGSLHDWAHGGRLGNWMTVNGISHPEFEVKSGSRLRLRLINAANARIFELHSRLPGILITQDGFACAQVEQSVTELAPAQRMDLILDIDDAPLTLFEARSGEPYPAFTINPSQRGSTVPKTALTQMRVKAPPTAIDVSVPVHMQGGAMGNLREAEYAGTQRSIRELAREHKKVWAFNGKISHHHERLARVERNQVVSIDVWNDSRWAHAMHFHGHHFWIKTSSGAYLRGMRDTYLFDPGERAQLVFIADNPGLWLFHCHMLEHHAAGMGAVIEVS
jgi:FtsP/CotA-like multicopper oxidase with cupredoxin domain